MRSGEILQSGFRQLLKIVRWRCCFDNPPLCFKLPETTLYSEGLFAEDRSMSTR